MLQQSVTMRAIISSLCILTVYGYEGETFLSGDNAPYPSCKDEFGTLCSGINVHTVVNKIIEDLEDSADLIEVTTIANAVKNGMYDPENAHGFAPHCFQTTNSGLSAVNGTVGTTLDTEAESLWADQGGLLAVKSSLSVQIYDALKNDTGVVENGATAWFDYVWSTHAGKNAKQLGYAKATHVHGNEYIVFGGFAKTELPVEEYCRTNQNSRCAILNSRSLMGKTRTNLLAAKDVGEQREVWFDITDKATGSYTAGIGFYMYAYAFGDNTRGECIAHGARADFVGKNLTEILDYVKNPTDGEKMHLDFVRTATNGGGFVLYEWTNSGDSEPFEKIALISGVRMFGTHKYYLGVGFAHNVRPYKNGVMCGTCSANSAHICSTYNAKSLIGHVEATLLTPIDAADAWTALTNDIAFTSEGGFTAFAFNYDGTCVADGGTPANVGKTWNDLNGENGLHEKLQNIANLGGGWISYQLDGMAKAAFVVGLTKDGVSYYAGVDITDDFGIDSGVCSPDCDRPCSEQHASALVGSVVSEIETVSNTKQLFSDITYQNNSQTDYTHNGFFVYIFDESGKFVAHGGGSGYIGLGIGVGSDFGNVMIADGSDGGFTTDGTFLREQLIDLAETETYGWAQYQQNGVDIQALVARVIFSPLDSADAPITYYVVSEFKALMCETRVEDGCPANAVGASDGLCYCRDGFETSFVAEDDGNGNDKTCGDGSIARNIIMTCTQVGCSGTGAEPPAFGTVEFTSNNDHGSTAEFGCDAGYAFEGTKNVTCTALDSNQLWPTPSDKPTCTEEESGSLTHYLILPIGMIISIAVVGFVGMKQDMAIKAILALMKDTVVLFASITLEFLDIISDLIVILTITSDDKFEDFVIPYILFFGTGMMMFLCHVLVNAAYLFLFFTKVDNTSWEKLVSSVQERQKKLDSSHKRRIKPSNRDHSVVLDSVTGVKQDLEQLKAKFMMTSHDALVNDAKIRRTIGLLALLIFEDIPMMVLNLMIITKFSADFVGDELVPILISSTIGNLMVAFKASSIYDLQNLRTIGLQQHKEAYDLLETIEEASVAKSKD